VQLPFGRRRVALLDNPRDAAVLSHDTAVSVGPLDNRRNDRRRRRCRPVCFHEPPQRFGRQERHVSGEQYQCPGPTLEHRLGLLKRVCRAPLRFLDRKLEMGILGSQAIADGLRPDAPR
jgi:hypothetical protein